MTIRPLQNTSHVPQSPFLHEYEIFTRAAEHTWDSFWPGTALAGFPLMVMLCDLSFPESLADGTLPRLESFLNASPHPRNGASDEACGMMGGGEGREGREEEGFGRDKEEGEDEQECEHRVYITVYLVLELIFLFYLTLGKQILLPSLHVTVFQRGERKHTLWHASSASSPSSIRLVSHRSGGDVNS